MLWNWVLAFDSLTKGLGIFIAKRDKSNKGFSYIECVKLNPIHCLYDDLKGYQIKRNLDTLITKADKVNILVIFDW